MPFLCCIRKLKEPENDLTLVQLNGDPRDHKKINANGVSTPIINVDVSREKPANDKSKENNKESHTTPNKATPDGNINSSALSKTRTGQEQQNERESVKKETLMIQEQEACELDSRGNADHEETQADVGDVQKYEELVSRLEEITDRIGIQFKDDSAQISTDRLKDLKAAAPAVVARPVDQPTFLEFNESSKLWHANNISDGNLTNIDVDVGQSVRISNCKNTTFRITGKVDELKILDSTSCSVVVEEVNEVIISNCKKLELQALEDMSVVRASDVDGLLVYLSERNANVTEFFTRKCSEVNFSCPTRDGQVELALSEQLSTQWDGQKWVSEVYTHKG